MSRPPKLGRRHTRLTELQTPLLSRGGVASREEGWGGVLVRNRFARTAPPRLRGRGCFATFLLSAQPSPPRLRRGVCRPVSQVCYCPKLGGQRDRRSRERAFLTRRPNLRFCNFGFELSDRPFSQSFSCSILPTWLNGKGGRFSKPVHTGSNPVVGSASERNTVRGLTVAQV